MKGCSIWESPPPPKNGENCLLTGSVISSQCGCRRVSVFHIFTIRGGRKSFQHKKDGEKYSSPLGPKPFQANFSPCSITSLQCSLSYRVIIYKSGFPDTQRKIIIKFKTVNN